MFKSRLIELVLLPGLLALTGCRREVEDDEKKKKEGEEGKPTSTSRPYSHRRPGIFFIPTGSYRSGTPSNVGSSGSTSSGGKSSSGSVGRGGFGSSGSASS